MGVCRTNWKAFRRPFDTSTNAVCCEFTISCSCNVFLRMASRKWSTHRELPSSRRCRASQFQHGRRPGLQSRCQSEWHPLRTGDLSSKTQPQCIAWRLQDPIGGTLLSPFQGTSILRTPSLDATPTRYRVRKSDEFDFRVVVSWVWIGRSSVGKSRQMHSALRLWIPVQWSPPRTR